MGKLLKLQEVAIVLRCSTKTVQRKIKAGLLPSVEVAGQVYLSEEQLEKIIKVGVKKRFERVGV